MKANKPSAYLDTSAIFAAVLSQSGGCRAILKLGEIGAISLWIGPSVLQEADAVLQRKARDLLPLLAALMDRAAIQVGPAADADSLALVEGVMGYRPDEVVLAEALAIGVDYFVTHDAKHFLRNRQLATLPCLIGQPGDFLAWVRAQLATRAQQMAEED